MHAQPDPRFSKRLPCKVKLGPSQYAGLVMNLSRSGLFVETGAGAAPGEIVQVALGAPTATPDIALTTRVVWQRQVPPALRATLAGGIGVEIQDAPERYYSLLAAVERLSTATRKPAALARFRIRVQQLGSARSRTLELDAESERVARRRALDLAGADWTITQVDCSTRG